MQPEEHTNAPLVAIVETYPILATLLVTIGTLAGYTCRVIEAEHLAALTWVEAAGQRSPTVLLIDIDDSPVIWVHPTWFIQQLRARWRATFPQTSTPPLICFTTQRAVSIALQMEPAVSAVIMKPFRNAEVLNAIKHVLVLADDRDERGERHD